MLWNLSTAAVNAQDDLLFLKKWLAWISQGSVATFYGVVNNFINTSNFFGILYSKNY